MHQVVLNEAELNLASFLATKRDEENRAKNVKDNMVGPQDKKEVDFEGVCGEIAFCKIFNVYPDMTFVPRKGGIDCVWHGKRIDIKTTKYYNGSLLAGIWKDSDEVDIYALMVGEAPSYEFKGWAYAEDLLSDETIGDLGYGKVHIMKQCQLNKELK